MKSAKSLTSALHSFFLLSSLLFFTLFESSAHFPLLRMLNFLFVHPSQEKGEVICLSAVTTSINIIISHFLLQDIFHIFYLFIHLATLLLIHFSSSLLFPPSALLYFSHCCFGLISLLAEAYWYIPTPSPPPPLTGVWAFNIQSMLPSSEPSFSTPGFDRQVPPLPPRPYRSRRMREGCWERGGRDRVHP